MHQRSLTLNRASALRCRLFLRQGWTFVHAFDPITFQLQTTTDADRAASWGEREAMRIGAALCDEFGMTVELRPIEPPAADQVVEGGAAHEPR